ncbi:hypothetical protein [Streptomyces sp. PvR034]|uniref:hypothetical protein n=1 Tax=Streptomyces sp. PvR034 TaxID=3156401 RepID=UPI003396DD02
MTRTSTRTKLAALAATAVMALGTGVLAASPASAKAADSSFGCPSGAVCIYEGEWNWSNPTDIYFSEGVHRIYNKEGRHIVYNNQTGGWTVRLCTGIGTGCGPKMKQGDGWPENLSPINSLKIERP